MRGMYAKSTNDRFGSLYGNPIVSRTSGEMKGNWILSPWRTKLEAILITLTSFQLAPSKHVTPAQRHQLRHTYYHLPIKP